MGRHFHSTASTYPCAKKFAKHKSVFMVINNSQTHAMYVRAEDVLNSPVVENKNERVPSGEKFYSMPLDKCHHINLLAVCN